jgi:hypothetical protein
MNDIVALLIAIGKCNVPETGWEGDGSEIAKQDNVLRNSPGGRHD